MDYEPPKHSRGWYLSDWLDLRDYAIFHFQKKNSNTLDITIPQNCIQNVWIQRKVEFWCKYNGTNLGSMKKYVLQNWEHLRVLKTKAKRLCYNFWSRKQEIHVIIKVSWDIPSWYSLLHSFNHVKYQEFSRQS